MILIFISMSHFQSNITVLSRYLKRLPVWFMLISINVSKNTIFTLPSGGEDIRSTSETPEDSHRGALQSGGRNGQISNLDDVC